MSAIIKGFNVPEFAGEHKSFDRYGCFLTVYKDGRTTLNICDAEYDIERVATPHGRLIDASELEKCVHEWYDVGEYIFADALRNADTVIDTES